jgi:hypothetical protein
MIEYRRKANRTEKNCVESAELPDTILRHHRAAFQVTFTTPVEVLPLESYIESRGYRLENLDALGNDFLAYAITGDDRNTIISH